MNRKERYAAQCAYEEEGARAGLQGKTRDDCPYDREANSDGWNFWVYGCENARGEVEILKKGVIEFRSEYAPETQTFSLPVPEAIERGLWKPRWAKP